MGFDPFFLPHLPVLLIGATLEPRCHPYSPKSKFFAASTLSEKATNRATTRTVDSGIPANLQAESDEQSPYSEKCTPTIQQSFELIPLTVPKRLNHDRG